MGHDEGNPERNFMMFSTYIKIFEIYKINNLMMHLKALKKTRTNNKQKWRYKKIIKVWLKLTK